MKWVSINKPIHKEFKDQFKGNPKFEYKDYLIKAFLSSETTTKGDVSGLATQNKKKNG